MSSNKTKEAFMKRVMLAWGLSSLTLASTMGVALAQTAPKAAVALAAQGGDERSVMMDLAKQRNCLACHAETRKLVGPSFKEISERYASTPGIQEKLATKILKGGAGAWGPVPMPANPQVSEEEARILSAWLIKAK
jgi:cytochrome c